MNNLIVPGAKALIIGGGIGGRSTASALARQGYNIALFERGGAWSTENVGTSLSINCMRALRDLGLSEAVLRVGNPLSSVAQTNPQREPFTKMDFAVYCRKLDSPLPLAIDRENLHKALSDSWSPKTQLHMNKDYISHKENADGVTVAFSDGTKESGDFVVGCDGLNSRVRAQLFGEQPLRYSGQTCWRGIAHGDAQALMQAGIGDCFEMWGNGRRFGAVPLDDKRVYWYATSNAPQGETVPKTGLHEKLQPCSPAGTPR